MYDRRASFYPQSLFAVRPGDAISASLTLSHHRWTVEIRDATSGARSRFLTSDETQASFNEAQWIQEHRCSKHTKSCPYPRPYLRLSTVRFEQLAVNSTRPSDADLRSQWMSTQDGNLAPSPLADDSFALRRQTLSSAGRRYLAIANTFDPAFSTFIAQLARWTATTPRSQMASAAMAFVTADRKNINVLASTRWPPGAQLLVDSLVRDNEREISQARSAVSSAGLPAWRAAMLSAIETTGRAGHMLRRVLDVPDFIGS